MKDPILVLRKLPHGFLHIIDQDFIEQFNSETGGEEYIPLGPSELVIHLDAPEFKNNKLDNAWLDMQDRYQNIQDMGFQKQEESILLHAARVTDRTGINIYDLPASFLVKLGKRRIDELVDAYLRGPNFSYQGDRNSTLSREARDVYFSGDLGYMKSYFRALGYVEEGKLVKFPVSEFLRKFKEEATA